ncbi:cobyrinate a,c-diamide synthase [Paenibacillus sp. TRM 82003]|nr:cobyrinate a,c-diamide synthase [Paenibacillus sp. TRM 82003]
MTALHRPRIVVAGTGSGAGKTTVAIGLMRALQRAGLRVQGFKCGPDYIDPTFHAAVTGRPSRNLDAWMLEASVMREIFLRGSEDADISVIEGVMGLYDGKDPLSNQGSTAEIATLLEAPVLLVVNVHSMARSAAATVLGFQALDPRVRIAGVVANRCGSRGHYEIVKAAIEQACGVPVVGWLGRDETLSMPERHLGLVPAVERGELTPLFDRIAEAIASGFDLAHIQVLADGAPPIDPPPARMFPAPETDPPADGPVIAVARDSAFHFYYPENLELLQAAGARLQFFSPVAGDTIPPEADGLYVGGGFPEEFLPELAGNERLKADLRARVDDGMPVWAECGGYMYLTRSIEDRHGTIYPMAGVIPARVKIGAQLAALGYRQVSAVADTMLLAQGESIRGHEFHYSTLEPETGSDYPFAFVSEGRRGAAKEGYRSANVTAGYTHIHLASNPSAATRWVKACTDYRNNRIL